MQKLRTVSSTLVIFLSIIMIGLMIGYIASIMEDVEIIFGMSRKTTAIVVTGLAGSCAIGCFLQNEKKWLVTGCSHFFVFLMYAIIGMLL